MLLNQKKYLNLVSKVDLIYCDVAQPNQTDAFIDNMNLFFKRRGVWNYND